MRVAAVYGISISVGVVVLVWWWLRGRHRHQWTLPPPPLAAAPVAPAPAPPAKEPAHTPAGAAARARSWRTMVPEDLMQPLFDRVHYPAAGTGGELLFWQQPIGASATLMTVSGPREITKTSRHTNSQASGC